MLALRNLFLRRGDKLLLENCSISVNSGEKLGLIGANGCGKSSLFQLLLGQIQPDRGECFLPPRWIIAHVAQETPALECAAIEHVLDGDVELRSVEAAVRQAEAAHDGERIALLHARYEAIDGYSARARAGRLLAGLGFTRAQQEQAVARFSGGWRVRLNLARALMARSDLLLLDEPSNHLDLDAVIWLEQYLRSYAGTLLLISHDRDFLDNVVDHIAHIEHRELRVYTGNYAAFEEQRTARLALQNAAFQKQQREIAHLQHFIERFRAKASKARQAQSRLKALARMERFAPAHVDSPFHFAFREPERLPDPLLTMDGVAVGYEQDRQNILEHVKLSLHPGSRIGLLGANGAGKSTLIKLLAGSLVPLVGRYEPGQGLRIGYFAQHQFEQLRADWSALQHLQKLDAKASEQSLRDFLGGFGFVADQAVALTEPFSGGEKARLVLALLVWQRPNLLLLDEPTNHLDLEMRHALTLALQEYSGALVIVSHDRHLLRTSTDEFCLVHNRRVIPFEGDLDDYRNWLTEQQRTTSASTRESGAASQSAAARRERKRNQAQMRNRLAQQRRPLEQRVKLIESEMTRLQSEQASIEGELADAELYQEAHKLRLQQRLQRKGELDNRLSGLEEEWLELHEQIENLTAEESD